MQVKIHGDAMAGMVVSMTTPEFSITSPHCLTFDYEVKASGDRPTLEIHMRVTDHILSGNIIWTSQDYISQKGKASITLVASNVSGDLLRVLDFVGIVAEPTSTLIRIANVQFVGGNCEDEQTQDSGIADMYIKARVLCFNSNIKCVVLIITKALLNPPVARCPVL